MPSIFNTENERQKVLEDIEKLIAELDTEAKKAQEQAAAKTAMVITLTEEEVATLAGIMVSAVLMLQGSAPSLEKLMVIFTINAIMDKLVKAAEKVDEEQGIRPKGAARAENTKQLINRLFEGLSRF